MEFKDRLRSLREEHGLSATQLAGQFSKSEGAIRMWETGRSKPDADTLIRLARYFNCTIDYLVGVDEYKNREEQLSAMESLKSFVECLKSLDHYERDILISAITFIIEVTNILDDEMMICRCISSTAYVVNALGHMIEKSVLMRSSSIESPTHYLGFLSSFDILVRLADKHKKMLIDDAISKSTNKQSLENLIYGEAGTAVLSTLKDEFKAWLSNTTT